MLSRPIYAVLCDFAFRVNNVGFDEKGWCVNVYNDRVIDFSGIVKQCGAT